MRRLLFDASVFAIGAPLGCLLGAVSVFFSSIGRQRYRGGTK